MAKHAKPKQTLRNAKLTPRGQKVKDFIEGVLFLIGLLTVMIIAGWGA